MINLSIPRRKRLNKPPMIVELKWDMNASTAINQIRDKNYPMALRDYKDNLLLVGVNYSPKTKEHTCIIK